MPEITRKRPYDIDPATAQEQAHLASPELDQLDPIETATVALIAMAIAATLRDDGGVDRSRAEFNAARAAYGHNSDRTSTFVELVAGCAALKMIDPSRPVDFRFVEGIMAGAIEYLFGVHSAPLPAGSGSVS